MGRREPDVCGLPLPYAYAYAEADCHTDTSSYAYAEADTHPNAATCYQPRASLLRFHAEAYGQHFPHG